MKQKKVSVTTFSKLIMLFSWTNLCSLMARPSFMRDCGSIPHRDLTLNVIQLELFDLT